MISVIHDVDMKIVHVVLKYTHFCFENHFYQHGQDIFKPIQSEVVSELNEDNPMLNDIDRNVFDDFAHLFLINAHDTVLLPLLPISPIHHTIGICLHMRALISKTLCSTQ